MPSVGFELAIPASERAAAEPRLRPRGHSDWPICTEFIFPHFYRVLMGKLERKRPLARPRRRWEDNIKRDFQEEGCGGMDYIELAQDRDRWQELVTAVMKVK